jgi:hypothetical protein
MKLKAIAVICFLALIGVTASFGAGHKAAATGQEQALQMVACLKAQGWTAITTGPEHSNDWVMATPQRLFQPGAYTYGIKFSSGQVFVGNGQYTQLNADEIALAKACAAKVIGYGSHA